MILAERNEFWGKWLVFEDKGPAILVLEFENMRVAREEKWTKADWGQMRRAFRCGLLWRDYLKLK